MRVWVCENPSCGEVWAQEDEPKYCPECSFVFFCQGRDTASIRPAGFTLEETRDAEEKFEVPIPIHVPEPPPFDLVQVSELPQYQWIGLPVFHPGEQMGDIANWYRYETGIITEFFLDKDFKDLWRCRFIHASFHSHGTLHYPASNLWTPKR